MNNPNGVLSSLMIMLSLEML